MLKEGYSEGRFYRTRDGHKAEIWKRIGSKWRGIVYTTYGGNRACAWHDNGRNKDCDPTAINNLAGEWYDIPDGFTPWHGGKCPVAPSSMVEFVYRDGDAGWSIACAVGWGHEKRSPEGDIIAYRAIEDEKPFISSENVARNEDGELKVKPVYVDTSGWWEVFWECTAGTLESWMVFDSRTQALVEIDAFLTGDQTVYICPFNDRTKMERVK